MTTASFLVQGNTFMDNSAQ